MAAIKARIGGVHFVGVGGQQMLGEGLEPMAALESLSVNGFVDPVKRLPSLVRIIRALYRRFLSVDVVVGVDFNVFNLLLERFVKRKGVPTAHFVSPAIYAWRQGRARKIGRSTDVVMALFPFEPALYARFGVRAEFVGHPLADEIEPLDGQADMDRRLRARRELDLDSDALIVAALPGSRVSEVENLGSVFVEACRQLVRTGADYGRTCVVIPCVNDAVRAKLEELTIDDEPGRIRLITGGRSRSVLAACDIALVKAGTSTLEAMLLRRPMVVSYRLGWVTYRIVKAMIRSEFVALPNILAGRALVPELLQDEATAQGLAQALAGELERARGEPTYFDEFERLHAQLRRDASSRAADVVLSLTPGPT